LPICNTPPNTAIVPLNAVLFADNFNTFGPLLLNVNVPPDVIAPDTSMSPNPPIDEDDPNVSVPV
jgi:hypothetical protein